MKIEDIINKINLLLLSKNVSSLFINGAPGSGKSELLKLIKANLPVVLSNTELLGPYKISSVESLISDLVADFSNRAMLRDELEIEPPQDLFSFWSKWADDHLCVLENSKLIVLIDLIDDEIHELDDLRVIFSGIRNLELIKNNIQSKFLLIVTGYWDHTNLFNYYNEENLSFPYTEIDNYLIWDGITFDQLKKTTISKLCSGEINPIYLQLLYEITSGHPGFLIDILDNLHQQEITYRNIIGASQLAAQKGMYANKMIKVWQELSTRAQRTLENLLLFRTISYETDYLHQLKVAGLIQDKQIGEQLLVEIRSYFIELTLYYHKEELGLNGILNIEDYLNDMMPKLASTNFQSFKIIFELENLLRNILVVWLHRSKSKAKGHILEGRAEQYVQKREEYVDAYERALDWRDLKTNSSSSPLISYLKIKDLSQLIKEMGDEIENKDLKQISEMVEKLADIRDLVMHNQLVGDRVFTDLWDIQKSIYCTSFFKTESDR